jgi:protein-tyrosine kinase
MSDLIERAAAKLSGKPVAKATAESRPVVVMKQRASNLDGHTPTGNANGVDAAGARADTTKHGPRRRIDLDPTALSRAGIMTPKSDSSRIVEEFRVIRRPLLTKAFSGPTPHHDKANVILVTSARPGEGKSFVAYNLAMSIASERNRQVVLIDADLRSSLMSRLLGVPPGPGLIELLASPNTDASEVMLQTDFPNLFLLPAGGWANQSTELLASPRMVEIVRELAAGRDDRIVILDAAPVLASSEPAVLAHNAGQIVLVVEAERTGRRAVEEALGHLGACKNISLVLNKARRWLSGDQFGAYYGEKHA